MSWWYKTKSKFGEKNKNQDNESEDEDDDDTDISDDEDESDDAPTSDVNISRIIKNNKWRPEPTKKNGEYSKNP